MIMLYVEKEFIIMIELNLNIEVLKDPNVIVRDEDEGD